ncbi:MAG: hypothetical protein PHY73_00535 [Candidatus Omnitrophica bacterium]|nr:hypothetical protein [Candidatus Omnitrophota bacterium]
MKIALVQFKTEKEKQKNINKAICFIQKAAAKKAKLVLFPEAFLSYIKKSEDIFLQAEEIKGSTVKLFMQQAKELKIAILLGSVYEKTKRTKKVYNTSLLISDSGKILSKYRKRNLFLACINGKKIDESKYISSGTSLTTGKIENFKFGFSICYDLRFADMYAKYRSKDVNVFLVPSAFTKVTGQKHWEVLLRARAIENGSYVLAPNQVGTSGQGIALHGNSMVVDPSGKILKKGSGHKEEMFYVELNLKELEKIKKILPR